MASKPVSPAEPPKRHPTIRPNAHPYAIKTTSSALLSRSNSSPHSAHHTRHHYVPSSPTSTRVSTAGTRVRHRHSSSLSSVEGGGLGVLPAPLPTPPSFTTPLPVDRVDERTPRRTRAETMPSGATNPIIDLPNGHEYESQHDNDHSHDPRTELYAGLPPNPKQWNTDELGTYLETSFRLHDHDENDDNHIRILECVRACGFTGRELLRLTDADLASMPLSDVQRAQLLEHSRTLRADVLRGRIYVDSREVSDSSNVYSRSLRSFPPFHTNFSSSISVDDLRLSHGNVEDGNEAVFPPSPAMSLHRSSSVSEASAQRYRDLARMRVRRRGRVKGLVETWERTSTSGSECSASEDSMSGSEAELESETDPESESSSDPKPEPELPSGLVSNDLGSPTAGDTIVMHHPPSLPLPPQYTHTYNARASTGVEEEEPSIEELLASSPDGPLLGARAWEADFGLGETVKRVPVISVSSGIEPNGTPPIPGLDTSRGSNDVAVQTRGDSLRSNVIGTRGSTGSKRKNSRSQKRVVTAIFTGSSSPIDIPRTTLEGGDMDVLGSKFPTGSGEQGDLDALRALEESLAETRAQLEAFRMRLEAVEADTVQQEAVLRHDQRSHSPHSRRTAVIDDETSIPPDQGSSGGESTDTNENGNWDDGMTFGDIARVIVTRAIGWMFPNAHPSPRERSSQGSRSTSSSNAPIQKRTRLPVVQWSYLIWFSFAVCAVVLRRMGFGRWVRRP